MNDETMARKLPIFVTVEEFNRIKREKTSPEYKLAFILGFCSGLRVSEVVNLKKENIHIKEKRIFIKEGKGKKDRVVPLPKGFTARSLKYIPIKKSIRSIQRKFKKVVHDLRIEKPVTFHSLRHGFATRLIESGVPINQVQLLMGHAKLETTGVYLHANPTQALSNYEKYF